MGRSKPSRSPAVKRSSLSSTTPKKPIQKVTPAKSGSKRPLPQDSESEEDIQDLLLQNGALKSKKGKFLPANDVSDDDVSGSEAEDSEDDDDYDENEDESEGSEDQVVKMTSKTNVSDDSEVDEDDDDDESEDDEDEDENESESSEEEPVKAQLKKSPKAPVTTNIKTSTADRKAPTPKKAEASKPMTHLLIPKPPRRLEDLKNLLVEKGYPVDHLHFVSLRFAHVTLPSDTSVKKLVTGETPFSIDGETVHFIELSGSADTMSLLSPESTNCLFLHTIPKSVTMEMLLAHIPKGCNVTSSKLLTTGTRNKLYNAAHFEFASKSEATTAMTALRSARFDGRTIYVGYGYPLKANAMPEMDIRVTDIPKGATEAEILSLFPGGKITKRLDGALFIRFPDSATRQKAISSQKIFRNHPLKVSIYGGPDGNARLLANLPLDTTESILREHYPEATSISMKSEREGSFNKVAFVNFPTAEAARSAVAKEVSINGKRVFAKCYFVEVSYPEASPKTKPTSLKPTKPAKKVTPPQVGSASEDEGSEEEEEDESDEEIPTKGAKAKQVASDSGESNEEEEDESEDEDDDDDEDEEESEGSEDEGIDDASDEEMPMAKAQDKNKDTPKRQFNKFDGQNRGFRGGGGGRGFTPRGRGFSPRGGFGRGRGGGGHDSGFKPRGGGRGRSNFQRGRGGFRGRRD